MEYVALFYFTQESKIYVSRCQLNEQLHFARIEERGQNTEHCTENTTLIKDNNRKKYSS